MALGILRFPPFRLDPLNQEFWRGSERITLRPKVFAVLVYLASNPQRLVTKHELLANVWADVTVTDELLRGYIRELRQALGDDATSPRFIETVSRRGYRFLLAVTAEDLVSPARASAERLASQRAVATVGLIGRDVELQALHDALIRAKAGDRRVTFVAGEPGTGKTALVNAFLEQAGASADVAVARGAAAQGYDAGEPFVPVVHALRTLCRGAASETIVRQLERHGPGWLSRLPDLTNAGHLDTVEQTRQAATTPARLRSELGDALEAIAREMVIVFALEDLQWADQPTVDLVRDLAHRGPARILIVATYRRVDAITSAQPIRSVALELQAERVAEELSVGTFSPRQVADYLDARFSLNAFPFSLSRAICESTDGNPALVVKLADQLVADGQLSEQNGRWGFRPVGTTADDEFASLKSFLEFRVRDLGPVLRRRTPLRVGVLHSLTGMMARTEMPVVDATLLAIEEINQRGGIRGHRIDPVVVDGESDEAAFAQCAAELIQREQVSTVFGCWTSASRKAVLPIVEQADHLLVYPVQYEGMEESPNILYTGAAPNQQIIPAVRWAYGFLGKRRFFLVGWDSIYSHAAHEIIRDEVASLGGQVVGEAYLLPQSTDIERIMTQITSSQADVILNTLVGDINLLYSRALHAAGHRPDAIPTVYFSVSEIELLSLSSRERAGDFAAWNYFQSLKRPENQAFVNRFRARYGHQRVTADPMEAAYVGVHLWAQAVEAVDRPDPPSIRRALLDQTFDAPEGVVRVDPHTRHLWKTFRLGQIVEGGQIHSVWSSDNAIRAEPFPPSRSRESWQTFLARCFERWGGRWTRPRLAAPV